MDSKAYPEFVDDLVFYAIDESVDGSQSLYHLSEDLKQLHGLTSRNYDSFDELIDRFLRAGIDIFQLETGIVSHITESEQYIVQGVVSPLDAIKTGDHFELEGTYCREVYQSECTLGFPCVGKMPDMQSHPVYENLKLEAYISAPIYVDKTLYGTLNFTDRKPRQHGFSEHERDLIAMMAESIGHYLLLREKESQLKEKNDRITRMAGYVAHDLRNPLGAIKGMSQLMQMAELEPGEQKDLLARIGNCSDRALELVSSILDMASLATGKLDLTMAKFALKPMLEECVAHCHLPGSNDPSRIDITIVDQLMVHGDRNRLMQVFSNLLINACKYSEPGSRITVSNQSQQDGRICIEVKNTIATQTDMTECNATPIHQSVGFGLDIVQEILALHDGRLSISEDNNSYKSLILLPTVSQCATTVQDLVDSDSG